MSWYLLPALLIVGLVSLSILCFFWIRNVTNQKQLKEDQEIISYALNTISLFYCVLVGLVVIDVQSERDDVQEVIVKEAAILMEMYHTANSFDFIKADAVNTAIHQYAITALQTELPLMEKEPDFAHLHYIHTDKLWQALRTIHPADYQQLAVYQKILDNMTQLTDARFKRFSSIGGRTTTFLWVILIYGGILVIACSLMFASKSRLSHAVHLSFNVSLISLILFLIYALDSPFIGPTAVSMTAFEKVIRHIDVEGETRDT